MQSRPFSVLFLCTGNSARSILAEALLYRKGGGRFVAFSAGSFPKGAVHPAALQTLADAGIPTAGLRSKSWDEFAGEGAPRIDLVITVCDNAAGEVCPIWPGHPARAHWGLDDPAAVEGDGQRDAFLDTFRRLQDRIALLTALPVEELDAADLVRHAGAIGELQRG